MTTVDAMELWNRGSAVLFNCDPRACSVTCSCDNVAMHWLPAAAPSDRLEWRSLLLTLRLDQLLQFIQTAPDQTTPDAATDFLFWRLRHLFDYVTSCPLRLIHALYRPSARNANVRGGFQAVRMIPIGAGAGNPSTMITIHKGTQDYKGLQSMVAYWPRVPLPLNIFPQPLLLSRLETGAQRQDIPASSPERTWMSSWLQMGYTMGPMMLFVGILKQPLFACLD